MELMTSTQSTSNFLALDLCLVTEIIVVLSYMKYVAHVACVDLYRPGLMQHIMMVNLFSVLVIVKVGWDWYIWL